MTGGRNSFPFAAFQGLVTYSSFIQGCVCSAAQVLLYVSAQRRIVGLAVVEPLKQAYRVVAPAGMALQQRQEQEHET